MSVDPVLTGPKACTFSHQLQPSIPERQVTFEEKVLGLLSHCITISSPRSLSESNGKKISADIPAGNYSDQMELVGGLAELKPEPSKSTSQSQLELAAHPDDDDVLNIDLAWFIEG